ncbi:MAG: NahK/ErcS family hybrid sensor histidine kinase/response regulator [Pseudomonadota bacterium]
MQTWLIFAVSLTYIAVLFGLAAYGDRSASPIKRSLHRPIIYSLSIAVYCTSWTYYGSVGLASTSGFEYLTVSLGPLLVFTFGMPLLRRMVKLSKTEHITSVADFIASRYGKNGRVAALAALIAVIGTIPYIALQLKAISNSVLTLANHYSPSQIASAGFELQAAVFITIMLSAFAILFGTRHADATEHQDGLILSVAIESFVKLAVFIFAALMIIFFLYGGLAPIEEAIATDQRVISAIERGSNGANWLVLTFLSASAVLVLPRQFHVTFVENRSEDELRTAGWLFPLYLVAINLLVFPIAISGLINLGDTVSPDVYLLALPLQAGHDFLAMIVFIGGLSAATAMVIVASVALAVMISNDWVIPILIMRRSSRIHSATGDWSDIILNVRRCAIIAIMFFAFAYFSISERDVGLASIGLISFAAVAQLTPALLIGLLWRGANARGAILGMTGGMLVWGYCLLLPTILSETHSVVVNGPLGIEFLRPEQLFSFDVDPLTNGVFWSFLTNIILLILGSRSREATSLERIQSIAFIPRDLQAGIELRRFNTTVTNSDIKSTLSRYLGVERMERAFWSFEAREGRMLYDKDATDPSVVRYAEQALASAIGASSARLVLSLVLEKGGGNSNNETVRLLDSASEAIQQNRDILQTALDQLDQGISVFDPDLKLTNWNGQFRQLLDLPPAMGQFGIPLKSILDQLLDDKQISEAIHRRALDAIPALTPAWRMPLANSGRIIEVRSNAMPDGGTVVTFADITTIVEAEEALKRSKQSLEARVQERTAELMKVNDQLAGARQTAEQANISKTRFLAAAGHDITQPLNAARIYASSMLERMQRNDREDVDIARKIDTALESVETIIGAVLDISRLDAGALTPSHTVFPLQEMFDQLRNDFQPIANSRGINLRFKKTSVMVKTDRNLLRRLLQNLVSNAIKYTESGRVLVGVRRNGKANIRLHVIDTGIGIDPRKATSVFKEFERLQEGAKISSGLGLGLSIVDRISRVLELPISLSSTPGKGSNFSIEMQISNELANAPEKTDVVVAHSRLALANMTIGCVDNESSIIEGMQVLLEGWGANVMVATDLEGLVEQVEAAAQKPDVLLVDFHLDNDATGLELIEAMRARYAHHFDAVLITADRSADMREKARSMDVTVLAKPLKPAQLRALLSNFKTHVREAAE